MSKLNETINGKVYHGYQAISNDYPQFSKQTIYDRYIRGFRGNDLVKDMEVHKDASINEVINGETFTTFYQLSKKYPHLSEGGYRDRYRKQGLRGSELIKPKLQ